MHLEMQLANVFRATNIKFSIHFETEWFVFINFLISFAPKKLRKKLSFRSFAKPHGETLISNVLSPTTINFSFHFEMEYFVCTNFQKELGFKKLRKNNPLEVLQRHTEKH